MTPTNNRNTRPSATDPAKRKRLQRDIHALQSLIFTGLALVVFPLSILNTGSTVLTRTLVVIGILVIVLPIPTLLDRRRQLRAAEQQTLDASLTR